MAEVARKPTRTSRAEMETTITFNRAEEGLADLCTADPVIAARWKRLGYPVRALGRYPGGEPRTWEVVGMPWKQVISFRRKLQGQTNRPPKGRLFVKKTTANPPVGDPDGSDKGSGQGEG